MRERNSVGKPVVFGCLLALWFILCGVSTAALVIWQIDAVKRIGEIAESAPAYWQVAVTVAVCILVCVGGTLLLMIAEKKSVAIMIVVWIIIVIVGAFSAFCALTEFDSAPHRAWHKYNDDKPIGENTGLIETVTGQFDELN